MNVPVRIVCGPALFAEVDEPPATKIAEKIARPLVVGESPPRGYEDRPLETPAGRRLVEWAGIAWEDFLAVERERETGSTIGALIRSRRK